MSRAINQLTATEVKAARARAKVYTLSDGGGLGLVVKPSGGRYWQFRYKVEGKGAVASFGPLRDVSLADARRKAEQARTDLTDGITPKDRQRLDEAAIAEDRRLHGHTFESVARDWYEYTCSQTGDNEQWTNDKHRAQVIMTLETYVFPHIGKMPVADIKVKDVRRLIDKLKNKGKFETAVRTFQRIGLVFDAAIEEELIEFNPCDPLRRNKQFMKRPEAKHMPSLKLKDLKKLVKAINKADLRIMTKLAVQMSLLTAVRPGELRQAEWSEFDLEARRWIIPKAKMKMKRKFMVPLSDEVIDILYQLEPLTGKNKFLYPHRSKGHTAMSDGCVNMALKRMGFAGKQTAHGFRSLFSTWAYEAKIYRKDVIETQLSHLVGTKVSRHYNFAEYQEERAKLMQGWANRITVAGKPDVASMDEARRKRS
jgi:integrase